MDLKKRSSPLEISPHRKKRLESSLKAVQLQITRSGWDLHEIALFAGHRNPQTTLLYIHLSGHDLADRLAQGMEQIHAWRVQTLAHTFSEKEGER